MKDLFTNEPIYKFYILYLMKILKLTKYINCHMQHLLNYNENLKGVVSLKGQAFPFPNS